MARYVKAHPSFGRYIQKTASAYQNLVDLPVFFLIKNKEGKAVVGHSFPNTQNKRPALKDGVDYVAENTVSRGRFPGFKTYPTPRVLAMGKSLKFLCLGIFHLLNGDNNRASS